MFPGWCYPRNPGNSLLGHPIGGRQTALNHYIMNKEEDYLYKDQHHSESLESFKII
jgi:hypothetical protein